MASARDEPTEIVDLSGECTLEQLCEVCRVEADWVTELVAHGVLDPVGREPAEWRFASLSIVHVAKAKRLQHDLGLNHPGIALAFDLLAEIDALRARLRVLDNRF